MSIRFNVDRLYFGIRKRDAKTRVTCEVVAFYACNLQAFFFQFPIGSCYRDVATANQINVCLTDRYLLSLSCWWRSIVIASVFSEISWKSIYLFQTTDRGDLWKKGDTEHPSRYVNLKLIRLLLYSMELGSREINGQAVLRMERSENECSPFLNG